jgi:hypothetical protein
MYNIINEGILITLRYQTTKTEPLSERTPAVNNVQISGINIRGAQRPVAVYGLEERDISEISFNDMRIFSDKGILIENASGVSFHDIRMAIKQGNPLEAKDSRNITWDLVSVSPVVTKQSFLKLTNCQNVKVSNCYQSEDIDLYVSGDEKCSDIYIVNNVLPGVVSLYNEKGKRIVIQNNTISQNAKPLTN